MLRWLWRLQSDRGGQHAEAGVLMATLVMLAGAVTVGSVPQMSTAVANQWVCHISDPGSERCGGGTTKGEANAGEGFTAKTFGASTTATTASYTDPAQSHFPVRFDDGQKDVTFDGYPAEVKECFYGSDPLCIGENGLLSECEDTGKPVPGSRYETLLDCSLSITDRTPLICTDEGLSPTTDTCLGPQGGVFHCTNLDANDTRVCRSADNDADTTPSLLESCSTATHPNGTAVCLGDNGTLYNCPRVLKAGSDTPCDNGTRDIDPRSLTDCVDIVSRSSGTTAENVSNGRVQRCTYVPANCDVEPRVPGKNYSCEPVSVRCLAQLPGDVDPRTSAGQVTRKTYQHCQSLGQVVEDGSSLQTSCVSEEQGVCEEAVTSNVSQAPNDLVTARVGNNTLGVEPDTTTTIDINGRPTTMDVAELTTYCETHASECGDILDQTVSETTDGLAGYFRDLGVCTTDCAEFVDQVGASFGASSSAPTSGRGLRASGLDNGINVVGAYSFAGAVAGVIVDNYVGADLREIYTVLGTISGGAYLISAIRKDLSRGDDSLHRKIPAATAAVAIMAAKKVKQGTVAAAKAAKAGGLTVADWVGTAATAAGSQAVRGGKAAQTAIAAHLREIRNAMNRSAPQAGATGAGDVEMGGGG